MKSLSFTIENTAQNNLLEESPLGLGLNFGASHHLKDIPFMQNLSQGADVVLGLIEKYEVKAGSTVTFDNLFTSLPLLDELTELEIDAFGTLQQKHFNDASVANKTTQAKKPRGSYYFATNGKNLVVS